MISYNSEVLLGTISYIGENTLNLKERRRMHRIQLDWLGYIQGKILADNRGGLLPYFRVEQCWSESTADYLTPSFDVHSIIAETPLGPGRARNKLLEVLYESDASWLICMDDDHMLFDHYNCHELFWDLGSISGIRRAAERCLITPVPTYWEGYKDEVMRWGRAETDWFLRRARIWGYLPIVAIPNLVKFGHDPIWFDESISLDEPVPEDLKFEVDWVAKGGGLFQCYMWPARSCGDMTKSTIFSSDEERFDRVNYIKSEWFPSYLKQLYPRNPDLWTVSEFKQRKNPIKYQSIHRSFSYTLLPSDLPDSEEKKKHRRKEI